MCYFDFHLTPSVHQISSDDPLIAYKILKIPYEGKPAYSRVFSNDAGKVLQFISPIQGTYWWNHRMYASQAHGGFWGHIYCFKSIEAAKRYAYDREIHTHKLIVISKLEIYGLVHSFKAKEVSPIYRTMGDRDNEAGYTATHAKVIGYRKVFGKGWKTPATLEEAVKDGYSY